METTGRIRRRGPYPMSGVLFFVGSPGHLLQIERNTDLSIRRSK